MKKTWWVATLLASACSEESIQRYEHEVVMLAQDDRGEPLASVSIALDGQDVGDTDASGGLTVSLSAPDGQRVAFVAKCPPGHEAARSKDELLLRNMQQASEDSSVELRVGITCPRSQRLAALIVRADGRGGLPVLINGERRAVTDKSGVAHIALRMPPGTPLRAELDTAKHSKLQPQNPQHVFAIGEEDAVVVFDQPFSTKRRKRVRKATAEEPVVKRPVRID